MKVIQTHEFKDGKFILTRTVSEFTDYELEVLRKLYKNQRYFISTMVLD